MMYNDICKNSRTGFLSYRLSSSANSLEDDRFDREIGEVERGAAQGGHCKISTLWNSMGWFMMAISHQWRHASPPPPAHRWSAWVSQNRRTGFPSQPHLALYSQNFPSPLNTWQTTSEREISSLQLSFFFSIGFFPPYHRYNPSYISLLPYFMRLIRDNK